MRPTPRLALLFALSVPLSVLIAGVFPALWTLPFAAALALLALFGLDAALTLPPRLLSVTVVVVPRAFIGTDIAVSARLRAARPPMALEILLDAAGDIVAPVVRACTPAEARDGTFSLLLRPLRRGRVRVLALKLRWQGPLRLCQRLHDVAVGQNADVVPDIRAVQSGALLFQDRDVQEGLKSQRDRGAGMEFDALREFVPGMPLSSVDWKHSARHLRLMAREMRVERSHAILLAFDTGLLMRAPIDGVPRLDHAISAGLLLAYIALRSGDFVGLYAFDGRVRHAGPLLRGTGAFNQLQHQAAALDYHTEETNFTLGLAELQARIKRRALVILFTDFVDTITAELMVESLTHLGLRHVVVFVSLRDPALQALVGAAPDQPAQVGRAVIAHDLLREREIVFHRLRRLGVHCLDVDSGAISTSLINRYVSIKQRGLL